LCFTPNEFENQLFLSWFSTFQLVQVQKRDVVYDEASVNYYYASDFLSFALLASDCRWSSYIIRGLSRVVTHCSSRVVSLVGMS